MSVATVATISDGVLVIPFWEYRIALPPITQTASERTCVKDVLFDVSVEIWRAYDGLGPLGAAIMVGNRGVVLRANCDWDGDGAIAEGWRVDTALQRAHGWRPFVVREPLPADWERLLPGILHELAEVTA